jgi:hypothetical protein
MEERGEEGGESDVDNRAEIRCRLFLLMRQARKDAIARAEGLGEWKNESEDCRCCCVACLEIVQNWSSRTAQKRTSLYFVFLITVTLPPFPPPSVLFYLTCHSSIPSTTSVFFSFDQEKRMYSSKRIERPYLTPQDFQ